MLYALTIYVVIYFIPSDLAGLTEVDYLLTWEQTSRSRLKRVHMYFVLWSLFPCLCNSAPKLVCMH